MPTTDDDVVKKHIAGCRANARESQYALFKHFHAYAMGICRRYAQHSDEASDMLSEGFLKVFNHIGQYDTSKPFKTWMARIITNTAIDYYRAGLRFSSNESLELHTELGQEATVYDKLAYDELLEYVRTLSPAYRTVFNLYAIDGYRHEEIAELLGITVSSSKSNLHKARKKLQGLLEKHRQEKKGTRT